jgi:hypothetical protein
MAASPDTTTLLAGATVDLSTDADPVEATHPLADTDGNGGDA